MTLKRSSIFLLTCLASYSIILNSCMRIEEQKIPYLSERILSFPDAHHVTGYWNLPVHKVLTLTNPLRVPVVVDVDCDGITNPSMTFLVPSNGTRRALIDTTLNKAFVNMCFITGWTEK